MTSTTPVQDASSVFRLSKEATYVYHTLSAGCLLTADGRPSHYDLTIKTDLKTLTFEGKVEIECVRSDSG